VTPAEGKTLFQNTYKSWNEKRGHVLRRDSKPRNIVLTYRPPGSEDKNSWTQKLRCRCQATPSDVSVDLELELELVKPSINPVTNQTSVSNVRTRDNVYFRAFGQSVRVFRMAFSVCLSSLLRSPPLLPHQTNHIFRWGHVSSGTVPFWLWCFPLVCMQLRFYEDYRLFWYAYEDSQLFGFWSAEWEMITQGLSRSGLDVAGECFVLLNTDNWEIFLCALQLRHCGRLPKTLQNSAWPFIGTWDEMRVTSNIIINVLLHSDRLCGLVVRVLGYRSGGQGSIPGTTRKKK
jgi:hypothetical protein